MNIVHIFFLVMLVLILGNETSGDNIFDVTNYGAVSDGTTDNSKPFLDAWNATCETGGTMLIPEADGKFMINGAEFTGPCNGEVTVQVDGIVLAPSDNANANCWNVFRGIEGLTIRGSGTFDGNGISAWSNCPPCVASIGLYNLKNVSIEGITSLNSKGMHIIMKGGDGVTFTDITIRAAENSPNTDGIDIAESNNVKIMDSTIGTGDDCIAIKEGCTNINITGVNCGPGHGISIGSIGKNPSDKDVQGVYVKNCNISTAMNGCRIKTWSSLSSSVTVSDVTYEDITMNNVKHPIFIDQTYCFGNNCTRNPSSQVQISNIKFIGISGTSASTTAVNLTCSANKPCQDIYLENIDLTLTGGGQPISYCANANVSYSGTQNPPPCDNSIKFYSSPRIHG